MKKTHAAISILTGLAAVAVVAQFTVSSAAPAATPPTGLVTPTFGGLRIAATNGVMLTIAPENAWISENTAGPVIFNDNVALAGGGGITAIGQNVKFIDPNATGVNIDAQIPIMNSNKSADGLTQYPVIIADDQGLAIGPTAAANELIIDGQTGYISAPGADPVTVADNNGLAISNDSGVEVLRLWGDDGDIERPYSYPVRIFDDEGLEVSDKAGNVHFRVNSATGAISNPYPPAIDPLPAPGDDPILLNDKVNITGNISNDTAGKPLSVNDDLYVAGNTGIGTPTPSRRLHVYGGASGGASAYTSDLAVIENAADAFINFLSPSNKVMGLRFGDNADSDIGFLTYDHNDDSMKFGTNNAQRMVITNSGVVGIGTSAPSVSSKLHINGAPPLDANSGQLLITESTTNTAMFIGRHQDYGFIQSHNSRPLALNPLGNNVGIGMVNPTARLSISTTGSELAGAAMSPVFRSNAGSLGTSAGNNLSIGSIGFISGTNNVALGIRAKREFNGTDWKSTSISLAMDVDNTQGAGASIKLGNEDRKVTINNNLSVYNHLSANTIGTYADKVSPSKLVIANGSTGELLATCPANQIAVACNYGTYNYQLMSGFYVCITQLTGASAMKVTRVQTDALWSGNASCKVNFYNDTGASRCAWVEAQCWDPNG